MDGWTEEREGSAMGTRASSALAAKTRRDEGGKEGRDEESASGLFLFVVSHFDYLLLSFSPSVSLSRFSLF